MIVAILEFFPIIWETGNSTYTEYFFIYLPLAQTGIRLHKFMWIKIFQTAILTHLCFTEWQDNRINLPSVQLLEPLTKIKTVYASENMQIKFYAAGPDLQRGALSWTILGLPSSQNLSYPPVNNSNLNFLRCFKKRSPGDNSGTQSATWIGSQAKFCHQSSSGILRDGSMESTQLIQKLAQEVWYCRPPYVSLCVLPSDSDRERASTSRMHTPHTLSWALSTSAFSTAFVKSSELRSGWLEGISTVRM